MLLHELDEDKNPARHYVLGNEYIGLDHNYYLTDEQGSVRYVLDAAGNVQNDYRYDAFGQCIAGHENIPNRLRYNAQIEDDLTGLYYLRARYYKTGNGRFTQEDVIYNDGLNLYAYCSSNPVMYSDPSGFAKKTCKSKVGGECGSESGSSSNVYIPMDADGNPIPLRKQNINGQDIPLPDPNASGPHTVLGGTVSSKTGEIYRQSATFPDGTWPTANGQNVPWSEVHWTDHGTPHHHTNPHQHIFEYNPDKGGWYRNEPTPYYP